MRTAATPEDENIAVLGFRGLAPLKSVGDRRICAVVHLSGMQAKG